MWSRVDAQSGRGTGPCPFWKFPSFSPRNIDDRIRVPAFLIRARREKPEVLSMRNDARGCHDDDATGTDRTASSKDDMVLDWNLSEECAARVNGPCLPCDIVPR